MADTEELPSRSNIIGSGLCLLSCLSAIVLTYYWSEFFNRRKETVIIKRRGGLVSAYTICVIMLLLFEYPLWTLLYWGLITTDEQSKLYISCDVLQDLLLWPFYYYASLLVMLRYWLIYYDLHLSHSYLNLEWKKYISSDITILKCDKWFVAHRGTLGNATYMVPRMTIFFTFWTCCTLGTEFLHKFGFINFRVSLIFIAVLFIFNPIFVILLPRKFPSFTDNLYLRQEARLLSIFWSITYLIYVAAVVIEFWMGHGIFTVLFMQFAAIATCFIGPFISTYWVLKQIKKSEQTTAKDEEYNVETPPISPSSSRDMTLMYILRRDDLFDLFMQHLIKELSMENLLAFIEFVQFKNLVITTFNIDRNNIGDNFEFTFPANVPISDIVGVYDINNANKTDQQTGLMDDTQTKFKMKAHKLYEKYVKDGSEFELNLPYRIVSGLDEIMGDYEDWIGSEFDELQMVKIFDSCLGEITSLLNGSKDRFKTTL